jgi:hypothetical protein
MIKIYRTSTHLTLPVYVDGKRKYVVFQDEHYGASVTDEKLQNAIEATSYFKSGEIKLFEQTGEKEQSNAPVEPAFEEKEFPEVTEIQQAVEILKGEPYLVAHQSLRSPENIKKQAEANGVKFPNLEI